MDSNFDKFKETLNETLFFFMLPIRMSTSSSRLLR